MKIDPPQVFMLFFAIFWSAVANVQPRWKAFQIPLMFKFRHVFRRVVLAVLVLNVLPIVYFGLVLWWLYRRDPGTELSAFEAAITLVVRGVLPALGVFGIYRIWIAIIELVPQKFYESNPTRVCPYEHVEPTYRQLASRPANPSWPVVDLGLGAWKGNFIGGAVYIAVGVLAACL